MNSKIKSVKSLATILLLLSVVFNSYAQTNKLSLAVNSLTTNFNYGNANSALKPYKKNYQGLQAGFSYQAGITSSFSIVPELYFAMKGATLKTNNPITVNKSTVRTYSLELPVLARFHINRLHINAGPYTAYNLGGRVKTEGSASIPGTSTKIHFGNNGTDFKRWDLGFQAGAGYDFKLKQSTLSLDVRYGYGLVNISNNVERYNRMLNISLQMSRAAVKAKKQKQG